jgi:uncharacterized protein (DUF305 family)
MQVRWRRAWILTPLFLALPTCRQYSDASSRIPKTQPGWTALTEAMGSMHAAVSPVRPSGDNDVDFTTLMLPHHQAAIDMAKAELLYGADPQMRRLAQEVITDQQSEMDLMQLWLKRRGRAAGTSHTASAPPSTRVLR